MEKDNTFEGIRFNLSVDPALKDPLLDEWLKHVNKEIHRMYIEQNIEEKVRESIALGLPLIFHDDGRVELAKDYYV